MVRSRRVGCVRKSSNAQPQRFGHSPVSPISPPAFEIDAVALESRTEMLVEHLLEKVLPFVPVRPLYQAGKLMAFDIGILPGRERRGSGHRRAPSDRIDYWGGDGLRPKVDATGSLPLAWIGPDKTPTPSGPHWLPKPNSPAESELRISRTLMYCEGRRCA